MNGSNGRGLPARALFKAKHRNLSNIFIIISTTLVDIVLPGDMGLKGRMDYLIRNTVQPQKRSSEVVHHG